MILVIKEDLTQELFSTIVDTYNNLSPEEQLIIYFYSRGGLTRVADCLKDLIEKNSNRTLIVGNGFLGSCAFSLFFQVKCNKELLPDTIGLFHQSSMDITLNESLKPTTTYDKLLVEMMKSYYRKDTKHTVDFCEFSEKERKDILTGKDVYFDQNRMTEIFKITQEKLLRLQ